MFKLLKLILALIAIVAVNGNGFTLQYMGNMKHPGNPNQCYFPEHDLSIPVNRTIYPKNLKKDCFKVHCREDFVLEIRHCYIFDPNNVCKLSAYDYTKVFPECCPAVTCGKRIYYTEDY